MTTKNTIKIYIKTLARYNKEIVVLMKFYIGYLIAIHVNFLFIRYIVF